MQELRTIVTDILPKSNSSGICLSQILPRRLRADDGESAILPELNRRPVNEIITVRRGPPEEPAALSRR